MAFAALSLRSKLKFGDRYKMPKRAVKTPKPTLLLADAFDFLGTLKPNFVDLIVSSPPYFMGKEYDTSLKIEDFIERHTRLLPLLFRALKPGGNLCWQVGHHVRKGVTTPLDAVVYSVFSAEPEFLLRNRIVWTFGHGVHARDRFSGRFDSAFIDQYQKILRFVPRYVEAAT